MVQFLKVPVHGNYKNFENNSVHYIIIYFQNSFNYCHGLKLLRTAPLPIHKVIKKCHILRWYDWDLLVFCKQTPSNLAAIGTLNVAEIVVHVSR